MALQAGLSVLVPLLVLWASGRQEWSIYATFGAFTSLYLYWVMVSAVVPLVVRDLAHQVVRGLHRLAGTAVGLAVAELLIGRYALALVAVTPLALLMAHLVSPVPAATLLTDRGVETLIGVVVGLAVGYLTRMAGRHPAVDMSA